MYNNIIPHCILMCLNTLLLRIVQKLNRTELLSSTLYAYFYN